MSISFSPGDVCPVCEMGSLSKVPHVKPFSYKGHNLTIDGLNCFECDVCSESFFDKKDEKRIERLLTDRRRKVDGLLTSEEIKSIRNALGFTQLEMAKFLGVGEKNFARYETGASTQSKTMDNLLRFTHFYPRLVARVLGDDKGWETFVKVLPFVNRKAQSRDDILVPYDTPWVCQNG